VTLVGLIADTHGLVRPAVFDALHGVALILHAGDVGGRGVLDELRSIAPVRAVSGNSDPPGQSDLQPSLAIEIGGLSIHVSHGHELGSPTPEQLLARYKADVIIYGHTHKALVERAGNRIVVNPGAAGPRRFKLEASVGRMTIREHTADVEIVWL
jgi:putative phosphoesterase